MTKLEQLTKRIQELVPEITLHVRGGYTWRRSINIEDVLRAIKEDYKNDIGFFVNQYGIFYDMEDEKMINNSLRPIVLRYNNFGWQLGNPLHLPKEETINFLYELLCTKE